MGVPKFPDSRHQIHSLPSPNSLTPVTPAKAGVQNPAKNLDSGFRRNEDQRHLSHFEIVSSWTPRQVMRPGDRLPLAPGQFGPATELPRLLRNHRIAQYADFFNFDFHNVSRLDCADPRRGSGGDDIARHQCEVLGNKGDNFEYGEDHVAGV